MRSQPNDSGITINSNIAEAAKDYLQKEEEARSYETKRIHADAAMYEQQRELVKLMNSLGLKETIAIRFPEISTVLLCEWDDKKGFHIFNLPPYSPHLNIIEILWRKMKYEWHKPEDYASFDKLTEAIKEILGNLETEYRINFTDRAFIK